MVLSKDDINFNDFLNVSTNFGIDVNEDLLFEEFILLQEYLKKCNASNSLTSESADQQWVNFFRENNAPNFENICNVIFSIPHSNAVSERIFSLMTTAWRKERNRLNLHTLEAELMIKHNFAMTCNEFVQYLKSSKGEDILSKISSYDKYVVQ